MKIGPQENAFDPSPDLDLLNVPKQELYACTLYEYGRESESIMALAREMQDLTFMHTSSTAPYRPMHSINGELAVILANLAPKPHLLTARWTDLSKSEQRLARSVVTPEPAVRGATAGEAFTYALAVEQLDRNEPRHKFCMHRIWAGGELMLIRVQWDQSRAEIKRQANAWIERMLCRKNVRSIRGRHAVLSTAFSDRLRELIAMRLLAHSPLKQVIEFVQHHRQRTSGETRLYVESLEDKRPTGRTAWENGVEAARKTFKKLFKLPGDEEPISWRLYQERKKDIK